MHDVVNLAVIVAYLVAIAVIGLKLSGRQRSATDYFTGERSLPWWAVMFSIVATETSTLTVISVPGVAYGGSFSYVELAVGYLVGRILVSFVLLPLYFRGGFVSAYQYLGERFGRHTQGLASLTFLVTRLLAEGVRLFAGAIPIKLLLAEFGLDVNYFVIVLAITAVTVAYTYVGGIKAVVWTDFLQMGLYLVGAVICVVVLTVQVGGGGWAAAWDAGKFTVFDFSKPILTSPYAFVTAIVGGALLTMGSHGSDQLIAQRVLSCRSLSDGRKAMIGSAVAIGVQFALFSLVGALLWARNGGAPLASLGLTSDQVFGEFILRDLPMGLSGLLVAGILAATMGSLSSALNSLSTSTIADIVQSWAGWRPGEQTMLKVARWMTGVWALVMVGFASLFTTTDDPVVELGLSIASYTYGALLGAFLLGLVVRRADGVAAFVAFVATLLGVGWAALGISIDGQALAFPWFVPLGVVITFVVGGLISLVRPRREPSPEEEPVAVG
ncbi:sodium:solute symporter [Actinomycetospora termitidis]|uniref:Sodium:solute symporter n=1 Tax=Actinomycetospora termitidis TaxID=3053470 RepID=A0ABT7M7Z2_9PSEU|nr:sodium:solute symporter [Actinomycetospora sp. Odt1-22]MDL5156693.1 sodium:solute symporter [Actinomycetospora sp. Odt1-22]